MTRFTFGLIAAIALTACAPAEQTQASEETQNSWADALGAEIADEWASPENRAFDFWIGEWEMNWRSKPEGEFYHQKEGSWTRQRVFPILGGKAIVELAWARDNPEEASQRGFSIRYYDPARERWVMSQNWPNENNQGLAFLDQLIGDEHLGRLSMYSITQRPQEDGTLDTQHRRYNFTDIRPGVSFRWDGSNTRDEGATWYTWYIVDAHRKRDLDAFGPAGTSFPGVHEEKLCTDEPHGAFDGLEGVWTGTATDVDGAESPAYLAAGKGLDGCGVLATLQTGDARAFMTLAYVDRFEHWVSYYLDDQPGTTHAYFVSKTAGEGASFEEADALAIKDEFTPYLTSASFDTTVALRRTVWEKVTDTEFAFRTETRENADAEWTAAMSYVLTRE